MTMGCDHCRGQLLDSLYGLLDPAEEAALAAHLAGCPSCTAAKAEAAGMKGLFASAAKAPFPEVKFEIPVEAAPAVPSVKSRPSIRWAIAAGLLVSLGILSPAIREFANYRDRAATAALAEKKVADLERSDAARTEALNRSLANLDRELADLRESHKQRIKTWVSADVAANAKPFRLEVAGPVAAIPGAPNEYAVVAKAGDRSVPVTVTASVRDSKNAEYFQQVLKPGETKLVLPASLWAKFPAGADDLVLAVSAADSNGATAELAEPIQLLAPVFTTLVVTDKPLYRPGERVFFRSLTLNRANLQPPASDLTVRFELRKPDGTALPGATVTGTTQPVFQRDGIELPIAGPDGNPVRGIACGVVGLPDTLPGGEYTLTAFELPPGWAGTDLPKGSTPIGTRKITVAKYHPEVLTKTLEFDAKTYGPGDAVKAKLTVKNQGKPYANIGLIVTAVYGANVKIPVKFPFQLKADGTAEISLVLPNLPDLKNPTLTVTILDQNNESLVRRIPLASKTLSLEFFPEGGDLIEGLPNRVYVRATTATGSPADVTGFITDGTRTICEVKTLTDPEHPGANQGLGVFSFTPEAGKRYALKLVRPSGTIEPAIKVPQLAALPTGYVVPKAEADGVTLTIPSGVFDANQPLKGNVATAKTKRNLIVGVYTRGLVVGHARIAVEPGKPTDFSIAPPAVAIGGVTRVTVFEEPAANAGRADLVPLAERLVFRRPIEKLKISYSADKSSYSPGDKVTIKVEATDEKNRPTSAVLMAAVVNQSVIAMADDKAERLLPTHFLLAGELQHPEQLEHADFVLTNHPKAAETLDLLLGTQGWRRFAEANGEFRSSAVSDAEKQRFWIANGRLEPMTESVRPDRATAKQLSATDAIDAKLDQLEAAKRTAEMERDRRTPEWQVAREEYSVERDEADSALSKGLFNLFAAVVFLVIPAAVVWAWRSTIDKRLREAIALLSVAALVLFGVALVLKDQFKMGSKLDDGPLGAMASKEDRPPPGSDLRDKVTNDPPPRAAVAEAPPRSDLGPAPPKKTVPAAIVKLNTDRADRAVRAVTDAIPSGAEMAAIDRIKKSLARHSPFVVREYAHLPAKSVDDTRTDFTETVLWQPVIVLPNDGFIDLNFHLSDATNAYRVLLAGHSLDGRLGSATGLLEVCKPLEVEAKLPPELSSADRPLVPVVATNTTNATFDAKFGYWSDYLVADADEQTANLKANSGVRRSVPVKPLGIGPARVRVSASGGGHADASERTVMVVPDGFPVAGTANFDLAGRAKTTVTIPDNLVPKSLAVKVQVFTNSLADIQSGLDGLIREPGGCFEQTSSSNYPNVLALEYLKDANRLDGGLDGGLADGSRGLLERGLARLASFEVQPPVGSRAGFEWFGAYPAHECLTAYGLVQFADMARVVPVDEKLLERTQDFLLARRDGRGGFDRKQDGHAFGSVPDAVANAYIVWALHAADPKLDLKLEAKAVADEALKSGDPYRLALAAIAAPSPELLKALAAKQQSNGSVPGAETTITRSRGQDLVTETTALAALAFLKAKSDFAPNLGTAIDFLVKSRRPHGAFGGTQATVLALKAIVAYNKDRRRPAESGEIFVRVDGKEVARLPFHSDDLKPIALPFEDAEKLFAAGQHEIVLETHAKQVYPASVSWSAFCRLPATAADAPLNLAANLAENEIVEGGSVRLNVKVENREAVDTGMAIAIVGLPAGLKLPPDFGQLKALTARPAKGEPTVSHWELNGRELALYWRGLGPKQAVELSLDLIADIPGDYRGPASRAYLYYGAESKRWLDPLAIRILPKK